MTFRNIVKRPISGQFTVLLLSAGLTLTGAAAAADSAGAAPAAVGERAAVIQAAILPPLLPWDGASRSLMLPDDHPWVTPAERSKLTRTPSYDETVAWLDRLVAAVPQLKKVSLGRSAEGRQIWMIVASKEGAGFPDALAKNGRPTVLAQAGIHAGEIDGKDAGLMLLRDLTVVGSKQRLLEHVNLLFIPILNVDGHERRNLYGRVNQRGPEEMGWRTNRRNLNLNRDYTKLETPALRAAIQAINAWRPDLYLDLHVTDGADYQYDITYGTNGRHAWSPSINGWLLDSLQPHVDAALSQAGHIPGPLVLTANNRDLTAGFPEWTASPRYSNGYGDARHLATILVENHSLKPYDQRVLGTYVFLEAVLEHVGQRGEALRAATGQDRARRRESVPLNWGVPQGEAPQQVSFLGVRSELELSPITGAPVVRWTGELIEEQVALHVMSEATATARRPKAYWIPPAWSEIAHKLALHGIQFVRTSEAKTVPVETLKLPNASVDTSATPFEGRARVNPGDVERAASERLFPAGSFRISTDQELGTLAVLLLEPESPDSLFQWGYFLEIFQRTEHIEPYVMEPMAREMLAADPALAQAFEQRLLSDREFAASPWERLRWFYERTPYYDQEYRVYPVGLEF